MKSHNYRGTIEARISENKIVVPYTPKRLKIVSGEFFMRKNEAGDLKSLYVLPVKYVDNIIVADSEQGIASTVEFLAHISRVRIKTSNGRYSFKIPQPFLDYLDLKGDNPLLVGRNNYFLI